ncbi:hypothetical protein ACP70R_027965 [Stipagrostis hirtigluma subsp. patula]
MPQRYAASNAAMVGQQLQVPRLDLDLFLAALMAARGILCHSRRARRLSRLATLTTRASSMGEIVSRSWEHGKGPSRQMHLAVEPASPSVEARGRSSELGTGVNLILLSTQILAIVLRFWYSNSLS